MPCETCWTHGFGGREHAIWTRNSPSVYVWNQSDRHGNRFRVEILSLVKLMKTEISKTVAGSPTLDVALIRFKRGQCPSCGKRKRELRGLEYRSRTGDLFCHTCMRPWPMELNLADLLLEFSAHQLPNPNIRSLDAFNPAAQIETVGIKTELNVLRRLFARIILRR